MSTTDLPTSAVPSMGADMTSAHQTSAAPSSSVDDHVVMPCPMPGTAPAARSKRADARRRSIAGTEIPYLPPRPKPMAIDRVLWPIVRRRIAYLPLPVWLAAASMCAALVLSHEVATTPLDILLISVGIALVVVGGLGIAGESYVRMITHDARIVERRNRLFHGYLRQRVDGHNATNHMVRCRCEHLTVAGCDLLVTVSPCRRVTW
jgi:hypothetical protein